MPSFFHELPDAKDLFATVAGEKGIPEVVVEKDYWVMHCLWGLKQQGFKFEMKGGTSLSKGWNVIDRFSEDIDMRFDPPSELNIKGTKPQHVKARLEFFDGLASKINIPGISVERNRAFDDERAQNGGISLKYDSLFDPNPDIGLKPDVLLEVGFARTAPNEPRSISSWVLDKALAAADKLEVRDNRASDVVCFNPEYTFVDKLQTICRRFRQYRDRKDPEKDRPRQFMRHYYDLYRLLEVQRVLEFIPTKEYQDYKREKLRGQDAEEFKTREPFTIPDAQTRTLFGEEFKSLRGLLFSSCPSFSEVLEAISKHAPRF